MHIYGINIYIRKFKDLNRKPGIISYFLHTMKLLFGHFHSCFNAETTFQTWATDVKEMYDSLPYNDILKAVHWALSHVREKSRRDSVAVFFKCTKKVDLGKAMNPMNPSISL